MFVQIELEQRMGREHIHRTKEEEVHAHADEDADQNLTVIWVAALMVPTLSSDWKVIFLRKRKIQGMSFDCMPYLEFKC